jgi:hypothetical protein
MKKNVIIVLTTLWLALSLYVRVVGLEISPISLSFDEAALGYNAYSILLTGKDEYGKAYPLTLRSYNDFKPALYAYLIIPFIHSFGLNQTAVRAPSAVLGTLSLLFLLLIFKQISKKSWLTSLFIVAVISFFPWRLHFSRIALETNISMAFFTGAVWCLLNFNKNVAFKVGAILLSMLSIYSYHSARLTIPILMFFVLLDPLSPNLKRIFKSPLLALRKLWPILVVLILYTPMLLDTNPVLLLTRFDQTNILSHFHTFTPSELIITPNTWLNPLANPLYYLGEYISGHVFAYISPKNLSLLIYPGVIHSGQVISGTGMLGFIGGILFIFGLAASVKQIVLDKEKRILLYWILAGIVPSVITWEWYYPLRALNMYPALEIIAGLGLLFIFDRLFGIKNKLITYVGVTLLLVGLAASSIYSIQNEYNYGAWDTNGEFQPGGYKEGAELLMSLKDKYKTVYLDSPHAQSYEMFWFYMKYPPQKVQAIADKRNPPGTEGPPTIDFDNFVYKKFSWPGDKFKNDFVFWTSSEVKEDEIASVPGAKLYRIQGPFGYPLASIITKK